MIEDPEVRKLKQQVAVLSREVQTLTNLVPDQRRPRSESGPVVKDARWNCQKCGTLLAWYDPEKDMLRIRYKDHILFSRVGGVSPTALTEEVLDWVDHHGIALEEGAVLQLAEAIAGVVVPGFVQAICRGCGEPNTQAYASPEEVEQARSGAGG